MARTTKKAKKNARGKKKKSGALAVKKGKGADSKSSFHPLLSLRAEIDRLFDDFVPRLSPLGRWTFDIGPIRRLEAAFGATAPAIDLVEADGSFQVSVELPGIDAENVEVEIADDVLTVKGQKDERSEEKRGEYHISERRFGSFQRSVLLPDDVDADAIRAVFDKGLLKITLPKKKQRKKAGRTIAIEQGAR